MKYRKSKLEAGTVTSTDQEDFATFMNLTYICIGTKGVQMYTEIIKLRKFIHNFFALYTNSKLIQFYKILQNNFIYT